MGLKIGLLKESAENETRVALVPGVLEKFRALDASINMQSGAGHGAIIPDSLYKGAKIFPDASNILSDCDVLLKVQPPTISEIEALKPGAIVIGFMQAYKQQKLIRAMSQQNITSFAVEFIPRISRAQSMDALSSQAAVAGYKAVLIAANEQNKFVPMLTTAAGTIRPSKYLVIGAGVAGLQAIATSKRLGAIIEAFDVRGATREQVESLGANFIDTGISAEGEGGYARELTNEEKLAQQEILDKHIIEANVVITTAAVPGKPAPRIISRATVEAMQAGSIIIDLGAESGGNCELTEAGKTILHKNVKIIGPINLPATLPKDASDMYSRNLLNFIQPAIIDGEINIDWEDEVFSSAVLTHGGKIIHKETLDTMQSGDQK
ncbi:MAG: NAD(P) transhydrogenase subunit alpha [Pseudomonadota bacterium]|nr:NAD(P) transhydrogenase subunit alpha [Pseudomonadota bacterium]